MTFFIKVLLFFWIIVITKQILFWIYLWQLKEYHILRFVDHFRTAKGKQLIFNKLRFFKIIVFILLFASLANLDQTADGYFKFLTLALVIFYFLETILFIKQIVKNSFKKPVSTAKSLFLFLVCLLIFGVFLVLINKTFALPLYVLVLDIVLPITVSIIVLAFQPFAVLARNIILRKAKNKMESFKNLTVIGITGSYGKTTTKEFLKTILQSKFKTLATSNHKNSEMGIADTILKELKPEHEIFIVEMGAYKKGGIKMLCDIINPKIGMVTGVTVQHLSLFGSLENLLSAEGGRELAESLPSSGFIAVNGENKYCVDLYKNIEKINKISRKIYTETSDKIDSDIFAKQIEVSKNNLSFVAVANSPAGGKHMAHFDVNILGRHNLQNILGAILVAKELGMSLEEISKACQNIKSEQAGIVLKSGKHNINIIDSSYSSNPDGAIADLNCLKLFGGKKIVVMPCLIELGEKSKEIHYKIGQKIGEICDLAIITSKDKFSDLKKGFDNEVTKRFVIPAKAGIQISVADKIIFLENSEEIYHKITTFCSEGDSVLLEGRVPQKLVKLLVDEE